MLLTCTVYVNTACFQTVLTLLNCLLCHSFFLHPHTHTLTHTHAHAHTQIHTHISAHLLDKLNPLPTKPYQHISLFVFCLTERKCSAYIVKHNQNRTGTSPSKYVFAWFIITPVIMRQMEIRQSLRSRTRYLRKYKH